ncbi:MAG: hypothetical protein WC243_03800 [Patescibacteria group bacterium]|jgi:predicted GH43/DUF377 family glycosyl hydrolase
MIVERYPDNPILEPNHEQFWEAEAVFNGCPARYNKKVYLVYRALSQSHYYEVGKTKMQLSTIGLADSTDGFHFKNRTRFIIPEQDWERFGCEDPRVTKLDDKYYIFYTALSNYPFSAEGIKIAVATTKNFKKIDERHLVTPFNAKGMALFPERINGKLWALLTVNTDIPPAKIGLVSFDKEEDMWDHEKWHKWYQDLDSHALPLTRSPNDQIEVGAPPIRTPQGWVVIYAYIKNYFTPPPIFMVEAVLLDKDDPSKVIAHTSVPILNPREYYEKIGMVPNIVFPSGTLKKADDVLLLYYGAADTFCAVAAIKFSSLMDNMLNDDKGVKFVRAVENPIISPQSFNSWESKATFNPAALYLESKFHIVYRAMGEDNTSVMGYATSPDGVTIDYRSPEPIYVPRESFEQKNIENGNSGCEDPRLTVIRDRIYMCYTAYDSINVPRVAMTWIKKTDFLARRWHWSPPVLISPPGLDDKDAFVFPQKVNNKYVIVHRSGEDMDLAFRDSLDFGENDWLEEYRWIAPRKGWWDSKRIGAAGPPVKTKDGWVLLYHGISEDGIYRIGALLLNLENPVEVLGRTAEPILEPEMPYERHGQVHNVVFPCSATLIKGELIVFYGGADKVVGMAKIDISKLLKLLKKSNNG